MGDLCFQDGQRVLFIGDSITDCGRRDAAPPLGDGYVKLLHDLVVGGWPDRRLTWINKGTGGNKVTDLRERWEDDVIREAPDWLSVKIGINDLHNYLADKQHGVSPTIFRATYQEILNRAASAIKPRLVLITPFYISSDRSGQSFRSVVLDLLRDYISIVEEMAGQFAARLVRLQPMFERQLRYRDADTFCPEPVHPNRTGHLLIAQEVLRVLCE
jgi:lysophospholipase L1-like esterase